MGAFNTLETELACPSCGELAIIPIQFKFGNCWQLKYTVGDVLTWGGNDVGNSGIARAVVDGQGESCPVCSSDSDFYIFVVHDQIDHVTAATGEFKFDVPPESYIVLET